MPSYYKRPGVYLEESLLVNPSDSASTFTVGAFVGVAGKGPINLPQYIQSWTDYVTLFGAFDPIPDPAPPIDPNDITEDALNSTNFANITALKADTTYGDAHYDNTPPFPGGAYVKLLDNSKAWYDNTTGQKIWKTGPSTAAGTPLPIPAASPKVLSYLPYSVYSFFQSGGRFCWVVRAAPTTEPDNGDMAKVDVQGQTGRAFTLQAISPGVWGNSIKYTLNTQGTIPPESPPPPPGTVFQDIFAIQILVPNSQGMDEVVETFTSMSITGEVPGTRSVQTTINDSVSGSRYVTCQNLSVDQLQPKPPTGEGDISILSGGIDPGIPDPSVLTSAAQTIATVDGPVTLNIVGYMSNIASVDTPRYALDYVSAAVSSYDFPDRTDLFVVNDSCPPRVPGDQASTYKQKMTGPLLPVVGDSYTAAYGPWVIIAHPSRIGASIAIPPGGGVMGVMSRIDATIGVFRAPAGVIAGLNNAVGVQTKFSDTELGDLNAQNINIIRSVTGAGICIMGGRTRKSYGADKYISARRTLIYLEESLKRSTQYAVFENNDQRLWSSLRMSADRILRPLWERGGLAGASAADAYYITCNDTINTPSVVQSGEVRMEIGVALEYPAEFVIIRITQFDRGTFTSEVTPTS